VNSRWLWPKLQVFGHVLDPHCLPDLCKTLTPSIQHQKCCITGSRTVLKSSDAERYTNCWTVLLTKQLNWRSCVSGYVYRCAFPTIVHLVETRGSTRQAIIDVFGTSKMYLVSDYFVCFTLLHTWNVRALASLRLHRLCVYGLLQMLARACDFNTILRFDRILPA